MRYILILVSLVVSSSVFAFDSTTNIVNNLATSGTTAGSGASTYASKKDKVIRQAQQDAATFVGSKGKIRGIYLQAALSHLRTTYNIDHNMTDLALAQAILAY